ncbi:MAG: arylsulfatase [Acidobacteria bacterium]|nr:arylsulfatase [Acidobacteriota bacterium]
MNRRDFLSRSVAAAAATAAPRARRPNVVLIITDDQGWGDLSIHGNPHLRTPNLDRIAHQGAQLTQFHVMPVCSPTRSCLMTGRYNYRTGVVDTFLGRSMMHADEVTLAEMLGAAGYRTGIFGKWHLGDNYPMRPIDQGFHEAVVHKGGGLGQPSDFPGGGSYFDPILLRNGAPERFRGYCTDVYTTEALRFVEANRDRPFFLYLPTNAPHSPLEIADSYLEPFSKMGLNEQTAKVYGMVASIDQNIGRLLARLDELKLAEDTIVIFLTDNGPAGKRYNGNMRGLKGSVYEGGIRVPFFLRWPRVVKPGARIDRVAAHIDVAPTLVEACAARRPQGVKIDGRSLMPLLRGEAKAWPDRTLFFQWHRGDEPEPHRACAARNQRWKLVDGKELYDLENDPAEANDVAAQHPGIAAKLRKEYEEWFKDVSSTRGYAPPRIHLGTTHENPVILTRQDWRGPNASWGAKSLGYWEVLVAEKARYDISVRMAPAETAPEVHFRLNGAALKASAAEGATEVVLGATEIPAGPGRLEVELHSGAQPLGVHQVTVRRLP